MADLVINNIRLLTQQTLRTIQLGEAVQAFDFVFQDPADSKFYLAEAGNEDKAKATHVTFSYGVLDDFVAAFELTAQGNVVVVGPVLLQAERYVLSATPGKMAPRADLITGQFLTELALAIDSSGTVSFDVNRTGVAIP